MPEYIQWARLADPSAAISALSWPDVAYMYLERIPERWLSLPEIANGVRFVTLDLKTPFQEWEHGRVFCSDFELRWEKMEGQFQTVLVGKAPMLTGFAHAIEPDLEAADRQTQYYLLWGQRVPEGEVEILGAQHKDDSQVFLEMRIPRVLRYPVPDTARQARLVVREYFDRLNGDLLYYRFTDVEGLL